MDAATGSVPYVSSTGNSAAAQTPNSLLEAAEGLALTFLERRSDGSAICTSCHRGSVAGTLAHAMTCGPGRLLELAGEQRPPAPGELVHATERATGLRLEGAARHAADREQLRLNRAYLENPEDANAPLQPPVGESLLRDAYELLEGLWQSREFTLYITPESRYGSRVHRWLTRYAEARLGRGFSRTNHADVFAGLETAADELVDALLTHDGDRGSACTLCHRGTVGGVLGHAESCAAGKLYGAIAAVREEIVGFDTEAAPEGLPEDELEVEVEPEEEAE